MEHDIARLEHRLRHIDRKRETIESVYNLLDPYIHRPGWTTVAEYELVMLALDNLEFQLSSIERIQRALVSAAQQIDDGPKQRKAPAGAGVSRGGPDNH
jgi:hypothetical protein